MDPTTLISRLLKEHRFQLVRQDKHKIYRNHENKIYVTSSTPSDHRWALNALSDLKRVIANPPKPMVLAISDYEREQAALVIAGEQRQVAGVSGAGKNKRSRGTGFIYDEPNVPFSRKRSRRKQRRRLVEMPAKWSDALRSWNGRRRWKPHGRSARRTRKISRTDWMKPSSLLCLLWTTLSQIVAISFKTRCSLDFDTNTSPIN